MFPPKTISCDLERYLIILIKNIILFRLHKKTGAKMYLFTKKHKVIDI